MKKHKFVYSEKINERKIYMVKCKKTGGEFSTILWDLGKIQLSKCPCCEEVIEKK